MKKVALRRRQQRVRFVNLCEQFQLQAGPNLGACRFLSILNELYVGVPPEINMGGSAVSDARCTC